MSLRMAWRAHCYRVPRIFDAQQRALIRLRALRRTVHEPEFGALGSLSLPDRPLCLDVGANRGQSIVSFKRVLPTARVISFEPEPSAHRAAAKIAGRYPDVIVHPFGLAAVDGEDELHIPECNGIRFAQLASINEPDPAGIAAMSKEAGYRWVDADDISFSTVRVPVRTLDSLELAPDVIKIDVEGAEMSVLAGAQETIARARPVILLERNHAAQAELARLGYRVRREGASLVLLTQA